jgi:hypothetical protein
MVNFYSINRHAQHLTIFVFDPPLRTIVFYITRLVRGNNDLAVGAFVGELRQTKRHCSFV